VDSPEEPGRAPRGSRVTLRMDSQGAADWSALSETKQEQLAGAISKNPEALGAILRASPELTKQLGIAGVDFGVKPEHVKRILKILNSAEKAILPHIINKQATEKLKRPFRLDPDIVQQGMTLTPEQLEAAAVPGAMAANEHLPQSIKDYIVKIGPLGEFLGAIAEIGHAHVDAVVSMQLARDAGKSPQNGEAKFPPASVIEGAAGSEGVA